MRVSRTHGVSHSVTASIESGTLRNGDRTDFWLRWTTCTEDRPQHLTAELGGGSVCLWNRNVPDDPSADVESALRPIWGPLAGLPYQLMI